METPSDIPAIGGDPDAFEAFYREHLPWVRRFVARRVDDPHAAADLTADIFLAVVDSAAGYREDLGNPSAWLAGISRNAVADHHRRRARESRANARISGRALLDDHSTELLSDRIDGERLARELYVSLAYCPTTSAPSSSSSPSTASASPRRRRHSASPPAMPASATTGPAPGSRTSSPAPSR